MKQFRTPYTAEDMQVSEWMKTFHNRIFSAQEDTDSVIRDLEREISQLKNDLLHRLQIEKNVLDATILNLIKVVSSAIDRFFQVVFPTKKESCHFCQQSVREMKNIQKDLAVIGLYLEV